MTTKKVPQYKVANQIGSSSSMFSHVLSKRYKTTNIQLAIEAANRLGGKPSDFLSKSVKKLALQIHPELDIKVRAHKQSLRHKA